MIPELTHDELSQSLDRVVEEILTAGHANEPPVDALVLARRLGISVAWDAQQTGRGRMVRLRGFADGREHGSILLRPEERRERLQWAVAHEIGEFSAVQVFERLDVDPREALPGARETVANQLAGRLLLPRAWFLQFATRCDWELSELKSQFTTASHELIARRMLDFEPAVAITIFDHGRPTFRRGTLGRRVPAPASLEMAAWRHAHEACRNVSYSDAQCRVQVWPVHEPAWKREILRTQWHTDDEPDDFC